jgi:hypothetical protein
MATVERKSKFLEQGTPDQHGWREVTVKQKIGETVGTAKYGCFGDGPDAPGLWLKYVTGVLPSLGAEKIAEFHDRWLYGQDLNGRQSEKSGGPAEPWVVISKAEMMNLATGQVRTRPTAKDAKPELIEGRTEPVERRIRYINRAKEMAVENGEDLPKAIKSGETMLLAAKLAVSEAGRLIEAPAAPAAPAPTPEAPAAPATRRR